MSFDFWAAVNSSEFQNQAAAENQSAGGFEKFEQPGEYDVTIKSAEVRQTKAGDQKLTLRVRADSGESGFWDLLVGHGGGTSQAARIAQQALALILKYSGAKAANPNALIGLRVKVWVKIEEDTGYGTQARFRPIGVASGSTQPAVSPAAPKAPVALAVKRAAPVRKVEVEEIPDDGIPF